MIQSQTWNLTVDANHPSTRVFGLVSAKDPSKPVFVPAGYQWDSLNLSGTTSTIQLPENLLAYELNLARTKVNSIPKGTTVRSILDLSNCVELDSLPTGLRVGSLRLPGCRSLTTLPEDLETWFLDLSGCWAFQNWPKRARVHSGNLNLRGCTALTYLPNYLDVLASLNVRDCSNLNQLPENLRISGWIDIAHSGLSHLKQVPKMLRNVDIRWQGVRIPERLWIDPESIKLNEILTQSNAEMRRVLIERFGQARFMEESGAEVLDQDQDAGGERRLLRVNLQDDEPLVTLACKCPSTLRQYYLRVPPNMSSCHQAAAWMAGFDNPDDYQPLIET